MHFGVIPKVLSLIGGLALLGMGGIFFFITAIGTFEQGKAASILMGAGLVVAALPLLAMPFSVRAAKALLGLFLVLFSALMLVATFNPPASVVEPRIYQAASVVLAFLVIFRLVLAWRRTSPGQT